MTVLSSGAVFGLDEELHRADLLLRVLREMICVVAPHEAGIGFLEHGAGEHPFVEGGCFGLVDGVLGLGHERRGGVCCNCEDDTRITAS